MSGCMCCASVCGCVYLFYFLLLFLFFIIIFFSLSDLCDDWAWVWARRLSVFWPASAVPDGWKCCHSLLLAASPTCGHVLTPGALGQGHWGCLVRLALSCTGWGLCWEFWGRSGSWGSGPAHGPCLGGGGLARSVGCLPWLPGCLCPERQCHP